MRGLTIACALAALIGPHPAAQAQPAAGDVCRDGLKQERAGALPRAFLELSRCPDGDAEGAAALRRVKKKLADGDYAPVSFSIAPAQAELRIAPFTAGAPLREPHTLWLPFGKHTWVASAPGHAEVRGEIVVDSPARIHLQVELQPIRRAGAPGAVDFEADGPAVDQPIVVADPRPKKHRSLIRKRFRGGLDGEHGDQVRRSRPAAAPRRRARHWPWILTWGL